MAALGVNLLYRSDDWAAVGFSQALAKTPRILPAYWRLKAHLRQRPPHLLVLIDFGAFNTRLGRAAKRAGIKVLYYFPPRSWDRNATNAASLREVCDRAVTPFPWSAERLREAGLAADFFGHPLLDLIPPGNVTQAKKTLGLPAEARVIGLFPGSRLHEVQTNARVLLHAARLMRAQFPDLCAVLSAAPGPAGRRVRALASEAGGEVKVTEDTYAALRASDVALLCSGSITLEAAVLRTPMVVFYRGTPGMWLQYALFYRNRLGFIAMPNLLAERAIVPELLAERANPAALAEAAAKLLRDAEQRDRMVAELGEVARLLEPAGAVAKTATLALQMAQGECRSD